MVPITALIPWVELTIALALPQHDNHGAYWAFSVEVILKYLESIAMNIIRAASKYSDCE